MTHGADIGHSFDHLSSALTPPPRATIIPAPVQIAKTNAARCVVQRAV